MGAVVPSSVQLTSEEVWKLVERQHGVVTREQLLGLGMTGEAVRHALERQRLHAIGRGVYAVGRPGLGREGRWMAAVLSCGPEAALSHGSAAALWGLRDREKAVIEISVPLHVRRRRPGVKVYRRTLEPAERTVRRGIPVTDVHRTLLDLATALHPRAVEEAINAADKLDLTDPERLRKALDRYTHRPGVAALRKLLDRHTFALTDSQLEQRFLPLTRRAGLPLPLTGQRVNGFKVDFFWPTLGLVVETDGLRYHRTAAQQARDRLRDQAHVAAGLVPLRFTYAQIRYEARYVQATLETVVARLRKS
jgi:very-short-patch-repair endonuclease/predicted transcriptional regulator of viral defense system